MPGQTHISVEKQVFCAGLYSFCIGGLLLLQNYGGNFLELVPLFLIFFAGLAFSSFGGKISDNSWVQFIVLLFYSGLILFFKDPLFFALAGGISAGTFSADAFSGSADKNRWNFAARDYLSGGIFGIILSANGLFVSGYTICIVLIIYSLSLFLPDMKTKRSGWMFASFFLILLSGIFYFSDFYSKPGKIQFVKKSDSARTVPVPLKMLNVLSLAHFPLDHTLFIVPSNVKAAGFGGSIAAEETILSYGRSISIHDQIQKDRKHYDLIAIHLKNENFPLYSKEFAQLLKQKLRPHGVVVYLLPDDDIIRAGALRASLQQNFKHIKTSGKVSLIAASDEPLKINPDFTMIYSLEDIFYPQEWDQKTAESASVQTIPTDRNYSFERSVLATRNNDPVYSFFVRYFPLKPVEFSCLIGGLILLYIAIRYMAAYVEGVGLRLTVFRDSVLVFLVVGFIFSSKTLGGFPEGILYCAALQFLLLSYIAGCYIPRKYAYMGYLCLGLVALVSCFLMPYIGIYFTIGVFVRYLFVGFVLPLLIRKSVEKYKTGTVEPSDLYSSVCSGLFTAAFLLAMIF